MMEEKSQIVVKKKEPIILAQAPISQEPKMITLADKEYVVKPVEQATTSENKEMNQTEQAPKWIMPVEGNYRISSQFGIRQHPITQKIKFHNGIDIAAPLNTPILAPKSGIVFFAAYDGINGNCIRVDHGIINGKSVRSTYIHLQKINVKPGQNILKGQPIGLVGSTGKYPSGKPSSTGPHLHMSVYENGKPVNPLKYIK